MLLENQLYRKGFDGQLLRCLKKEEPEKVVAQVHKGICGAHQAGIKMRWLLRWYGYYWPTIMANCIKYGKSCQSCQKHSPIQRVPTTKLHSIIKPCPFRGWAMDLIGKINPVSS